MNKNIKYFVITCTTLISSACAKTEVELQNNAPEGVEITITAVREGFDPNTRNIRESDGSVEWCPLDEISVFYTETTNGGSKFTSQNTEQTAIAEFKGKLDGLIAGGEEFTNGKYLYGVYPYSSNTCFKDGVTTISLPSHQTAAEGTFANGLFPTIARAQGVNLAFYNICGGVKFTVSRSDITSIKFKGNNGERLAGSAKVIFDDTAKPSVLNDEVESKDEITVFAPAGGTFEAGKEYYIVAYPVKLSSGFTMTFRTSDMKEGAYISNSSAEIKRSVFGVLNQIDKNVTSWSDITSNGGGENSGIYLGIMGFNQQLYSYPIEELSNVSKPGFDSFIDDLNMKNGTLLYYSVDQAINTLQSVPLPADLSTAAIVTFTDGLDQGSMMMNVPYGDDNEYLDALNNRIMNETVNRQPITAFSIGIRGQDVSDVTKFRNNLTKLASSSANATEVTSMAEVNAKFKEIAEQLSQSNYIQTINLKMPGVSNGTLVRFTFDNVNSADKSTLYIEGTFNLTTRSLENVEYKGLKSTSGTTIKGVVDGIFVTFTFEGVHTDNNVLIDSKFTDEWTYITSNNTWQINSEFDKTENSDIVTERSSAVIMLVLDCSSSLANDFATAQNNAKDFINTLYEAVGGDSGSGENPGGNDNTIYSTTPTDLSVAIWQDGVRYYLTPEQYKNANLSNATVEGLTIVSNMGNFIISPNLIQFDWVYLSYAMEHYSNVLPDKDQATVISARYIDINNRLSVLGWSQFSMNRGYNYLTKTPYNTNYNYTISLYDYKGGKLDYNSYGYIRGILPIKSDGPIIWNDERDLCLSVVKNGDRIFLKNATEDLSQYDKIEGLAIVLGEHKFIIKLSDEQSGTVDVSTAMSLYGDILPDKKQAEIISMKYNNINSALNKFGGNAFSINRYNSYLTKTSSSTNYNYAINLYDYYGGKLTTASEGYIRGVISFE